MNEQRSTAIPHRRYLFFSTTHHVPHTTTETLEARSSRTLLSSLVFDRKDDGISETAGPLWTAVGYVLSNVGELYYSPSFVYTPSGQNSNVWMGVCDIISEASKYTSEVLSTTRKPRRNRLTAATSRTSIFVHHLRSFHSKGRLV